MWNARHHDRGSGGPVLRDPLASRSREQPYELNFRNRQNSLLHNNGSFNQDNFGGMGAAKDPGGIPALFPPTYDEALFPPTPPAIPAPFQQGPPMPLLGLKPNNTQLGFNERGQEPLVFRGGRGASLLSNNGPENASFNFQRPPPAAPLLATPENFQDHSQSMPFFGDPSQNFNNDGAQTFNNNGDFFERRQQEPTLNLQPQWSVNNDDGQVGDQVHRSFLQDNNKQLEYERRPFIPKFQQNNFIPPSSNNNGQGYERRPAFNHMPSGQTNNPNPLSFQPQRPLIPPLLSNELTHNSNVGSSSSGSSFPSSRFPITPGPSHESHNQRPIPSLWNRNSSSGFNMNNNKKPFENNKGQNFNQKFQQKRSLPTSGTSSSQSNITGNNITIKPKSGPLLPTPKLIPYPPPPLLPKSSNTTPSLLRNPRGILKNSISSSYSNFVKGSNSISSNENSPSSSVVPYTIGDDDDDDEDYTTTDVQNSEEPSSNMTHDFFSEKMVKHFASVLNGKQLEEQLDGLLKYLVLPADFLATRVAIVRNLHVMLSETFKNCNLQPYGADFIGVGNSDDSVNVFVDLTGKHSPSTQIDSKVIEPLKVSKETLDELLHLIKEEKNYKFFGQIVRRTHFTCNTFCLPVISFIHSETKVRCNIRLDNYLLVQEAKIAQFVCSLDPRISPMLAVARYWSSVHKVLDTPEEDTKNRFITLLILFFLARKKIIPTMAHLQSLSVKREYFRNLEIGFCDDHSLVPPNENPVLEDKTVFTLSTLSLLKEFFHLFANMKTNEVISLWKAELIPKENFSPELEGKVLSPDLRKKYRYGVDGKLRNKRIDCRSRICIQDFQDLSENLSISVADYDVTKFQIECNTAYKRLESIMTSGSGNLMDLFVVSEYESYGTKEHRKMHEKVYLLFSISDGTVKADSGQLDEPLDIPTTDVTETGS